MRRFALYSIIALNAVDSLRYNMKLVGVRNLKMTSTILPPQNIPEVQYSTLNGKALRNNVIPTLAEAKAVIPKECFVKNTALSLSYALLDLVATASCFFLGYKYILPIGFSAASLLAWIPYSIVTGTVAISMWVTAHECGHGAFSTNKKLQDFVGYVFHTFLLVPYFSWQRSHNIHHANTNHVVDGETHVPIVNSSSLKTKVLQKIFGSKIGNFIWGSSQIFLHLIFGWPAYLLTGKTGGYSRGVTNHFIPFPLTKPNNPAKELFGGVNQKIKVLASDVGIAGMLGGLYLLSKTIGLLPLLALYGGPLIVVNSWLVLYTWLQHTQTDIPHVDADEFSFIKGAFLTVDRPYEKILGGIVNFLHHDIGTTHGKWEHAAAYR